MANPRKKNSTKKIAIGFNLAKFSPQISFPLTFKNTIQSKNDKILKIMFKIMFVEITEANSK